MLPVKIRNLILGDLLCINNHSIDVKIKELWWYICDGCCVTLTSPAETFACSLFYLWFSNFHFHLQTYQLFELLFVSMVIILFFINMIFIDYWSFNSRFSNFAMIVNAECSSGGRWLVAWLGVIMEVFRLRTHLFTLQQLCSTADVRQFWCFVNFILNQKRGAVRMIDARHGPARNQINH